MINFIAGVFKYSLAVLAVLVLSHVIEIQGVTISQHVLNGMRMVGAYNPKTQGDRMISSFTKTMHHRVEELNKLDAEVSPTDQKELNRVIQNSQNVR